MDHEARRKVEVEGAETGESIRRTLDGSIDFRYYERRGRMLRAQVAGDIFDHVSRMLPFFRTSSRSKRHRREARPSLRKVTGCGT